MLLKFPKMNLKQLKKVQLHLLMKLPKSKVQRQNRGSEVLEFLTNKMILKIFLMVSQPKLSQRKLNHILQNQQVKQAELKIRKIKYR